MSFVKTTGRIFNVDKITCALVYPEQTMVYSEDYHPVTLTGEDAQRINAAMKEAGFVGDETLINPTRVSVAEDAGATMRVFLAGSDRIVTVPREIIERLMTPQFPAPESQVERPVIRRKKGGE